jgi:hypothetical protein
MWYNSRPDYPGAFQVFDTVENNATIVEVVERTNGLHVRNPGIDDEDHLNNRRWEGCLWQEIELITEKPEQIWVREHLLEEIAPK